MVANWPSGPDGRVAPAPRSDLRHPQGATLRGPRAGARGSDWLLIMTVELFA